MARTRRGLIASLLSAAGGVSDIVDREVCGNCYGKWAFGVRNIGPDRSQVPGDFPYGSQRMRAVSIAAATMRRGNTRAKYRRKACSM